MSRYSQVSSLGRAKSALSDQLRLLLHHSGYVLVAYVNDSVGGNECGAAFSVVCF